MTKRKHKKRENSSSSDDSSSSSASNSSKRKTEPDRSSKKPRKLDPKDKSKWDSPDERNKRSRDSRYRSGRSDESRYRSRDSSHRYSRRPETSSGTSRNDRRKSENRRRRRSRSASFDHKNAKWGRDHGESKSKPEAGRKDKQKPDFALSGKLTEETNTFRGVVIKYSEPPEARKPKRRWRLYPFKGEKALQTLYIHRESAYLIGRERKVVDLPVDHPSCSKQHAVLQYRLVQFTREDGSTGKRVRPYLIDLESANGTFINNKKIEPKRFVELMEKDVIKFGFSSREYVLLHENSKDEKDDDDVKDEEEEVAEKVEVKKEN